MTGIRKTAPAGWREVQAIVVVSAMCLFLSGCKIDEAEDTPEETFGALVKIVAADAADSAYLGISAAVDGSIAVVGAPGADSSKGAAYVYYRNNGGTNVWGQAAKLVAADAEASDSFGVSVAVSGDYILVGASSKDGAGTDRGAAYVFYRNQGGTDAWGQVKKLVAGTLEDGAGFGAVAAMNGSTAAIGASGEDGAGTNRGAVYVFDRDQGGDGNWGQVARLTASTPEDSEQFGYSVALNGDLLIVGVPGRDGAGSNRGSAAIYSRDLGGADAWGLVKTLLPVDPSDESWFGYSVSINGAFAVVGAPGEDGAGSTRGAAYMFERSLGGTDGWGQIKKLGASDATDSDQFGYSVSIDRDADLVVVGGPYADGAGTQIGHAYVFTPDKGGTDNWGQFQLLDATDAANYDLLGYSVAVSGDFILAGAPGEDGAGTLRGAAYMFRKR